MSALGELRLPWNRREFCFLSRERAGRGLLGCGVAPTAAESCRSDRGARLRLRFAFSLRRPIPGPSEKLQAARGYRDGMPVRHTLAKRLRAPPGPDTDRRSANRRERDRIGADAVRAGPSTTRMGATRHREDAWSREAAVGRIEKTEAGCTTGRSEASKT